MQGQNVDGARLKLVEGKTVQSDTVASTAFETDFEPERACWNKAEQGSMLPHLAIASFPVFSDTHVSFFRSPELLLWAISRQQANWLQSKGNFHQALPAGLVCLDRMMARGRLREGTVAAMTPGHIMQGSKTCSCALKTD